MAIYEIFASIFIIVATVLVVATAIAQWRAPDALTRVNLLGPTVGLAVPLLLVTNLIVEFSTEGFNWWSLVRALLACFGVWIFGSVGSYYMGRAVYGVSITDVRYAQRVAAHPETTEDDVPEISVTKVEEEEA